MVEFILNLPENYKTDLKLREGEDLPNEIEDWANFASDSDETNSPTKNPEEEQKQPH